jgi:hypothetical protein
MPAFTPTGRTVRVDCHSDEEHQAPANPLTSALFESAQFPTNLMITNPNEFDVFVHFDSTPETVAHRPLDPRKELPKGREHHGGWGFRVLARQQITIWHGLGSQVFMSVLGEGAFIEVTPGEGK